MHAVSWKPIVVGVDESPQAALASAVGEEIAKAAGTDCWLVHAWEPGRSSDSWDLARARIQAALPAELRHRLEVHHGKAKDVLPRIAQSKGAGLLVVGGKHHSAPVRWFGGSTAHQIIRTSDIPILILGRANPQFRRCLVAIDASYAAGPTLEMARRLGGVFAGTIRVVHATLFPRERHDVLQEEVRSILGKDASLEFYHGTPLQAIRETVKAWKADVLVVGSHGKGFTDRALLGSTTQAMLKRLPTALLVAPIRVPKVGSTWLLQELSGLHPRP